MSSDAWLATRTDLILPVGIRGSTSVIPPAGPRCLAWVEAAEADPVRRYAIMANGGSTADGRIGPDPASVAAGPDRYLQFEEWIAPGQEPMRNVRHYRCIGESVVLEKVVYAGDEELDFSPPPVVYRFPQTAMYSWEHRGTARSSLDGELSLVWRATSGIAEERRIGERTFQVMLITEAEIIDSVEEVTSTYYERDRPDRIVYRTIPMGDVTVEFVRIEDTAASSTPPAKQKP